MVDMYSKTICILSKNTS